MYSVNKRMKKQKELQENSKMLAMGIEPASKQKKQRF